MADRKYIQRKISESRNKLQYAEVVLKKCVRSSEEDVLDLIESLCKKSSELTNHALTEIHRNKTKD